MKLINRYSIGIIITLVFTVLLSGCTDITKSSKYTMYELKYLVNLTDVSDDLQDITVEKLKKTVKSRLNNFDVTNIQINQESEEENKYITVKFGTIDEIKDIKKYVEGNDTFRIKKKIDDDSDYAINLENKANETLKTIIDGADFRITAQNEVISDPERIVFATADKMYTDEIKEIFTETLFNMEPGTVNSELVKYTEPATMFSPKIEVITILKLFGKETVDRVTEYAKEVEASHILVAYEGAMRAADEITRTQEEAKAIADEVKAQLSNGGDFILLAKEYSDDQSNNMNGGVLGTPAGQGVFVEPFELAALALEEEGEVSEVIETSFGYHIIKATKITPASKESHEEEQVSFGVIFYAMNPAEWENTDIAHEHIKKIDAIYSETYDPFLVVTLNQEGKNLLKELTEANMDNMLGLFIGKNILTSFTIKEANETGELKILNPTTTKEADEMKENLTMDPLPAPIILVGEIKE